MKRMIVPLLILSIFLFSNKLAANELTSSNYLLTIGKSKEKSTQKDKEEKKEKKKKEPIIESDYEPILLGALLENPIDYLNKKIKFRGRFSSFSTLALDYNAALRKSKDYISICIFRPDSMIPLSELKLAYPVEDAKEDLVIRDLEESDLVEIYGQVFSAALDEPWVDIISMKNLDADKKDKLAEDKIKSEEKENKAQNPKSKKNKKKTEGQNSN